MLAAELVNLKVDLITTRGTPAALAAKSLAAASPTRIERIAARGDLKREFHQILRADVRTHGDHIAAVRTISINKSPVSPTQARIGGFARSAHSSHARHAQWLVKGPQ